MTLPGATKQLKVADYLGAALPSILIGSSLPVLVSVILLQIQGVGKHGSVAERDSAQRMRWPQVRAKPRCLQSDAIGRYFSPHDFAGASSGYTSPMCVFR